MPYHVLNIYLYTINIPETKVILLVTFDKATGSRISGSVRVSQKPKFGGGFLSAFLFRH